MFLVFAFVVCLDVVFVCLFCDVFVCFSSSFYKIVYTLSLCDQGEKARSENGLNPFLKDKGTYTDRKSHLFPA